MKLWHIIPNDSEFRIIRTQFGWTGKLTIEGVPPFEDTGHTAAVVLHKLVSKALEHAAAAAASRQPAEEDQPA